MAVIIQAFMISDNLNLFILSALPLGLVGPYNDKIFYAGKKAGTFASHGIGF